MSRGPANVSSIFRVWQLTETGQNTAIGFVCMSNVPNFVRIYWNGTGNITGKFIWCQLAAVKGTWTSAPVHSPPVSCQKACQWLRPCSKTWQYYWYHHINKSETQMVDMTLLYKDHRNVTWIFYGGIDHNWHELISRAVGVEAGTFSGATEQ